jgi:hypothetical protein
VSWTDKEHGDFVRAFESGGVLAVATRAAELLAARGGTMDADELRAALVPGQYDAADVAALVGHIAAQGARVAALETELARLKPSGQVAEDELHEALDAIGLVVVLRDRSWHLKSCRAPREKCSAECDSLRPHLDTLSRLAAGAQGLEAVRAALNDNFGADGDPVERVRELLRSEEESRAEAHVEQDERHRVEDERDAAMTEAESLRARVAELEEQLTSLNKEATTINEMHDAASAALETAREDHRCAREDREGLVVEVERLKAEAAVMQRRGEGMKEAIASLNIRVSSAESIRAAIRTVILEHDTEEGPDFVQTVNDVRKALEGAAPNSPGTLDGSGNAPREARKEPPCICAFLSGQCNASRHPCSERCIHDDTATPGHPERVKERSEALRRIAVPKPIATGARVDDDETTETAERAGFDEGLSQGWGAGAEAMRAACWEAVRGVLERDGIRSHEPYFKRIKAAIKGAAP